MTPAKHSVKPKRKLSWSDPFVRGLIYQVVVVGLIGVAVWYLVSNTLHNLSVRNISTGFDFLGREAGFAIGESVIAYQPTDSYGRAVLVGIMNTLKVSLIGAVFATLLGTVLGVARLSSNWLVSKVSAAYIEVMRNVPLLLQLFFWYALITETMPGPRNAHELLPGVFLSNRGLKMPSLEAATVLWMVAGIALALVLITLLGVAVKRHQERTGKRLALGRMALGIVFVVPAVVVWLSGASLQPEVPVLRGFNFVGGMSLSPEFFALLVGLIIYTSAFVAEVVRSGIQAVSAGQWEAAAAIGLPRSHTLALVILPQALRVIIPPMTSQYLNLTKNSSLAVAIGYPDIVSVVNTTLNQTGQAIEGVLIIMAAYLTVSLSISVFMNWYNKRMALVER